MASFEHTVNPDQATFLGFGLEGVAYGIHTSETKQLVLIRALPQASM
jgi:hypothetical protein